MDKNEEIYDVSDEIESEIKVESDAIKPVEETPEENSDTTTQKTSSKRKSKSKRNRHSSKADIPIDTSETDKIGADVVDTAQPESKPTPTKKKRAVRKKPVKLKTKIIKRTQNLFINYRF